MFVSVQNVLLRRDIISLGDTVAKNKKNSYRENSPVVLRFRGVAVEIFVRQNRLTDELSHYAIHSLKMSSKNFFTKYM